MNIKAKREELGLSQKELAEKAGISQSFMCDIEQGRCKPSLETAVKLAKALKVKNISFFKDE